MLKLFLILSLARFDEASCHVMTCCLERAMWPGPEGGLWPMACEDLEAANDHQSEPEGPSPGEPSDEAPPPASTLIAALLETQN